MTVWGPDIIWVNVRVTVISVPQKLTPDRKVTITFFSLALTDRNNIGALKGHTKHNQNIKNILQLIHKLIQMFVSRTLTSTAAPGPVRCPTSAPP